MGSACGRLRRPLSNRGPALAEALRDSDLSDPPGTAVPRRGPGPDAERRDRFPRGIPASGVPAAPQEQPLQNRQLP